MVFALPETAKTQKARLDLRAFCGSVADVLRDRRFVAYTLAGGFGQACMFAYISGSPFVLIELFHVSPQAYGVLFGANAVGLIVGSQVNHRLLATRTPEALLRGATLAVTLVGLVLMGVALSGRGGLPAVAVHSSRV